jgi:hypothetical protein
VRLPEVRSVRPRAVPVAGRPRPPGRGAAASPVPATRFRRRPRPGAPSGPVTRVQYAAGSAWPRGAAVPAAPLPAVGPPLLAAIRARGTPLRVPAVWFRGRPRPEPGLPPAAMARETAVVAARPVPPPAVPAGGHPLLAAIRVRGTPLPVPAAWFRAAPRPESGLPRAAMLGVATRPARQPPAFRARERHAATLPFPAARLREEPRLEPGSTAPAAQQPAPPERPAAVWPAESPPASPARPPATSPRPPRGAGAPSAPTGGTSVVSGAPVPAVPVAGSSGAGAAAAAANRRAARGRVQ